MFWYVFFSVLYFISLSTTLALIYSAGVLNSRADRMTEELIFSLRYGRCREVA
jgi:hypothetical protein